MIQSKSAGGNTKREAIYRLTRREYVLDESARIERAKISKVPWDSSGRVGRVSTNPESRNNPYRSALGWHRGNCHETFANYVKTRRDKVQTKKEKQREREITTLGEDSPAPSSTRIGALVRVHGAQLDVISTKTRGRANYFSPSDFRSRPLR